MYFSYKLLENLPPLAWVANCFNGKIEVIHGNKVECKDKFFVDGAWNGAFIDGNFIDSSWFCGTGAEINNETVIFSTPTHIIGGLYVAKIDKGYCISNSLYLLMSLNRYKLDKDYLDYETDFNTILFGVNRYKQNIHILDSYDNPCEIQVYYYRNIEINDKNEISVKIKPNVKPFADFEDYYTRLKNDICLLAENSRDKNRRNKYGIVTTISKGYDAPCCAVLAKLAGCDTAVTFKPEGKYAEDCGTEIAKGLGYSTVIERSAEDFKMRSDCIEAMYVASGELGANISFSAFEKDFKDNLVFMGDRGDSIWARDSVNRNNDFSFNDMVSHLGSVEVRLWIGYIQVPMPLYGASQWTSIYDISNSDEMRAWQLNNGYDRPVPRRIVETAGVNREAFGVEKHGAGFVYRFDWMKRIKSKMSLTASSSFEGFVKQNRRFYPIQTIKYFWKMKNLYLFKLGLQRKPLTSIEISQIPNPTLVRYLIPWGGQVVLNRYKNILKADDNNEYTVVECGDTK